MRKVVTVSTLQGREGDSGGSRLGNPALGLGVLEGQVWKVVVVMVVEVREREGPCHCPDALTTLSPAGLG